MSKYVKIGFFVFAFTLMFGPAVSEAQLNTRRGTIAGAVIGGILPATCLSTTCLPTARAGLSATSLPSAGACISATCLSTTGLPWWLSWRMRRLLVAVQRSKKLLKRFSDQQTNLQLLN